LVGWSKGQPNHQPSNAGQSTNRLPTNSQPNPQPSLLIACVLFLVPSVRKVLVHVFPWVGLLGLVGLGWVGWSVDWLVGWLVKGSTKPSTKQRGTINQPTPNQLLTNPPTKFTDWLCLFSWFLPCVRQVLVHVSPWVGLLGLVGLGWAGWSVDCMVGWSVGWLVGQMVNQTINQATRDNQLTNSQPTPNQTPNQVY